jgi:hypothetical protein
MGANGVHFREKFVHPVESYLQSFQALMPIPTNPCFEHYHKKASAFGITPEDILEAVELANKVKSGAHLVMRSRIKTFMGGEASPPSCGCNPSQGSCCD